MLEINNNERLADIDTSKSRTYAAQLMSEALGLGALMDNPESKIIDRVIVKLVTHRLDALAMDIKEVQLYAKYAADEIIYLAESIEEAKEEESEALAAARATLKQYAEEVEAAKEKTRKAESRVGRYADLYENLLAIATENLTPEQMEAHNQFKARTEEKTGE